MASSLQRRLSRVPAWRRVLPHAVSMAVLALVGALPATAEIAGHLRADVSPGVAPWAYVVLWIAWLQLGYAVYLVGLPDWSSLRVAAHASLFVSAFYAIGLGMGLSAGLESSPVVALGLSDRQHAGHVAPWCLIMTSLSAVAAYLIGRSGQRWGRRHLLSQQRAAPARWP